MKKTVAVIGSLVFLVIAPGFVTGLIPWWLCQWQMKTPFFGFTFVRIVGVVLFVPGAIGLLDSFARFPLQGLGTPSPVLPTKHLVVTGLYRYVRNPMYVAVASLIFGQGLFFGSPRVLEYGCVVCLLFHLFVLLYEEPTLKASFGEEYKTYCSYVRRWLPRLTPWKMD